MSPDVLIIGAGVAGLSAAIQLALAGLSVEILEARDRIGGRIYTKTDPALNHSVDLGAEFVHGIVPEIWLPIQRNNLNVREVDGDFWCSIDGKVQRCNFFAQADKILEEMNDKQPDESFLDFLARCFPGNDHADGKRWATGYVSGFNAADPNLVSVHWLVHSRQAEEQVMGDRAFRITGGYHQLVGIFRNDLERLNVPIHLNTVVSAINWRNGSAEIVDHAGTCRTVRRVLVTVPLGVLQSNALRFDPQLPPEKQTALSGLLMGKVVRVVCCFREPFWREVRGTPDSKSLADLSFLFSRDDFFPTWWTLMPDPAPIIVGWAPAKSAESMSGLSCEEIVDRALASLSQLLRVKRELVKAQLTAAYFHDWDSDPFSRGAYSYVKVGAEGSQKVLGSPVEGTLFFAGEATDVTGHNGTVHGAIASGQRAAQEILEECKP